MSDIPLRNSPSPPTAILAESLKVLVADPSPSFQQAIGDQLAELRPDWTVRTTSLSELEDLLAELPDSVVVVATLPLMVQCLARAWVLLEPGDSDAALVGREDGWRTVKPLNFADIVETLEQVVQDPSPPEPLPFPCGR